MIDQEKIGAFLRELRKDKGQTQEEIAEKFGTSSKSVSRWENGKTLPDLAMLVELADYYEVDIKEIIDEGIVSDGGAFVIEAYGKKDGKDVMVELHLSSPGLIESYEKAKMTGEMYLTGQGAFLYTKLFVNDMIDQKGLISSDMLDDKQVEQYIRWAEELGITYTLEIKEGVLPKDLKA